MTRNILLILFRLRRYNEKAARMFRKPLIDIVIDCN